MYPKKSFEEMTKEERVLACYQHACLLYEDRKSLNNESVRERFGLDKNQSGIASHIITDTIEAGYIKSKIIDELGTEFMNNPYIINHRDAFSLNFTNMPSPFILIAGNQFFFSIDFNYIE